MWMIKKALGWGVILFACILGLNFWRSYLYVKADDNGIRGLNKNEQYFVDVRATANLDRLCSEREIVCFIVPGYVSDEDDLTYFFGRIVARPGDSVELNNGILKVNGENVTGHLFGLIEGEGEFDTPTKYDFKKIVVARGMNYILSDAWKGNKHSYSMSKGVVDSMKIGQVSDGQILGIKSQVDVVQFGIQVVLVIALAGTYLFIERFVK
ncbi:hypothetical protein ACFL54_00935 [Planctomycetota bacterium]